MRRAGQTTGGVRITAREIARLSALVALVALIFICLAWELWLAPLRPGGSLLALKALPLTLPLSGILKGRRYTYQWSSMLILAYFAEGVTRALSDTGPSQKLAILQAVLSIVFFAAAVTYARCTRASTASSA